MIYSLQDKQQCSGCTACFAICPQRAIRMEPDSEGFLYPSLDENECINCHLCETVCPALDKNHSRENKVKAYAAYSKNCATLNHSSSGGIFREIAEFVIQNKGVVYGAAFGDDHTVKHTAVERFEDLQLLQGSKYLQSDVNDCFIQAKQMLETGRLVLFTGTPCQVEGLKKYLKRDYDNLLTQDIVCHGVPSPLVWKKYIAEMEKNNHTTISDVNFRDKKYGWHNFSLRIGLADGSEYRKVFREDPFMRGFLDNVYLRLSCYACHYKTMNRISDFTLADFWGVQNVCPEIAHPKGASLVWLNTDKSKMIWEELKDRLIYKKVDLEQAVRYNTAATSSVLMPKSRMRFFALLDANSVEAAVNAVLPREHAYKKIVRKVKKTVRAVLLQVKHTVKQK